MSQIDMTIDARGDACPIPVVKTKQAMAALDNTGVLEVLVDNETAVQNVTKMGQKNGAQVTSEKRGDNEFALTLTLSGDPADTPAAADAAAVQCAPDARTNQIIVISSNAMGNGDDVLGEKLMKAFIFAVIQQEELPQAMVFYNGGVKLTTEGSEALGDLKSLEAQGVEIVSCGTCLDYYGLTEKLAVGSVTNMYDIVERMEAASSIVKPS